jgi:hypothetical protein
MNVQGNDLYEAHEAEEYGKGMNIDAHAHLQLLFMPWLGWRAACAAFKVPCECNLRHGVGMIAIIR